MSKLTIILPSSKASTTSWKHLPNLRLADPTFNTPSGIELILGAELYETIMLDARIKEHNNITYRDALFGWVVIGGSASVPIQSLLTTCFSSMKLIPEDTLKKFWEIEDLPQSRHFTKEEQACEEHYQRTTKRNQEGQFVVRLPFKDNATPAIPSRKRNAASTRFSADLLEMKVSTPDTLPSSKNSWILDKWSRSRTLKSPSNPAKAFTCPTTAS